MNNLKRDAIVVPLTIIICVVLLHIYIRPTTSEKIKVRVLSKDQVTVEELRSQLEARLSTKDWNKSIETYLKDPDKAREDIIVLLLLSYLEQKAAPGIWMSFSDLDTRFDQVYINKNTREFYEDLEKRWQERSLQLYQGDSNE